MGQFTNYLEYQSLGDSFKYPGISGFALVIRLRGSSQPPTLLEELSEKTTCFECSRARDYVYRVRPSAYANSGSYDAGAFCP